MQKGDTAQKYAYVVTHCLGDPEDGEQLHKNVTVILKEFGNYKVENFVFSKKENSVLNDTDCDIDSVEWLFVHAQLPSDSTGSSSVNPDKPFGIELAESWVEKFPNLKAVVLRTSDNVEILRHFADRITIIRNDDFLYRKKRYDYMKAAQCGYTLFPPTFLDFRYTRDADNDSFKIRFEKAACKGSLKKKFLEGSIETTEWEIKSASALQECFHDAALEADPESRKERLYHGGRKLHGNIKPTTFLKTILEYINTCIKGFPKKKDGHKTYFEPSPVHIRIHADSDTFHVPLDLAFRENKDWDQLCARFPVTWIVDTDQEEFFTEKLDNFLKYEHHHVLYSCEEEVRDFPAIKGVKEHADSIAKYVKKGRGKFVGSKEELREILIEKYDSTKSKCAYVVSHGVHPNAKNAGVILTDHRSSSAGTQNADKGATAEFLRPNRYEKGPNFVYFNCCSLGHQSPPENTTHTAFGGFAQGIISNGFTKELICNRWPVDIEQAFKLAEHFFELRPLSSYARAAALHRARRLVQDTYNENPTWLAPIHILAKRRGGY